MRQIKFRGKRVDTGQWVYGFYRQYPIYKPCGTCIDHINHFIDFDCFSEFVDPSTVGQYTGLKDKNGREIYEGDILRLVTDFGEIFNREVYYWDGRFCIHVEDETDILSIAYAVEANSAEISGNIHDNPDLINPKE